MPNGKAEHYLKSVSCRGRFHGKNTPKRKTRIASKSARRIAIDKQYTKQAKAFLATHPVCKLWLIKNGWKWLEYKNNTAMYVQSSDKGYCITTGQALSMLGAPQATTVHHGHRRGKFLLDESTWHELSLEAHQWVEAHPKEAEQMGLLSLTRNSRRIELPPK